MKLRKVFLGGLQATGPVWVLALLVLVAIPVVAPDSIGDWAASWTRDSGPGVSPGTQVDERSNLLVWMALGYGVLAAFSLASCWSFLDARRARDIAAGVEVSRRKMYAVTASLLGACLWLSFQLSSSVFFGVEEELRDYASEMIRWVATPPGGIVLGACVFAFAFLLGWGLVSLPRIPHRFERRNVAQSLTTT